MMWFTDGKVPLPLYAINTMFAHERCGGASRHGIEVGIKAGQFE